MAIIIKQRRLANDNWRLLEGSEEDAAARLPSAGDVIVPLSMWRARRGELASHGGRLGLLVDGEDDPAEFGHDLSRVALIAVRFPKFTDGRGFSLAHLLRTRYAFRGELRAVGDIFRDQLPLLESCGFDAFELRAGEDPQAALSSFDAITEAYQASVARSVPLFRRRDQASDHRPPR